MSDNRITGNIDGVHRVNARALNMGQYEFTEAICDAIRRAIELDPFGVKTIARAANANIRTVENWAAKRSTPDGLHLVRLMATVPEVQAEVRRLAAMDADLDPEFERDLARVLEGYQRLKALK
jgi:DNA-binding transcriptional regulator YiaG